MAIDSFQSPPEKAAQVINMIFGSAYLEDKPASVEGGTDPMEIT
jgi:hypothetical protein